MAYYGKGQGRTWWEVSLNLEDVFWKEIQEQEKQAVIEKDIHGKFDVIN